ncbi:hypothetical protein D3C86_1422380 [compost metagenome]
MHHQRRQVVRGKAQSVFEGLLRLFELGIVCVQAGQLILVFGALRLTLERMLPGIDGLLQRAEIQAKIIRRKPQQRVDGGQAYALLGVIEQRPQQQTALPTGDQSGDAFDRGNAHVW